MISNVTLSLDVCKYNCVNDVISEFVSLKRDRKNFIGMNIVTNEDKLVSTNDR